MPLPNDEKTPKTTQKKTKSSFAFPKKAAAPPKVAQKKIRARTDLPTYLPASRRRQFFWMPLVQRRIFIHVHVTRRAAGLSPKEEETFR